MERKKGNRSESDLGRAGISFPSPRVDPIIQLFLADASLCGTFSFAEEFRESPDCLEIPSVNFGFVPFD